MLKRILAIFKARNLEFLRDRGTLSWNIILPVALMFGLSFIFSSDRAEYTVGVLQAEEVLDMSAHPFLESRYIEFVPVTDPDSGFRRVARHQLDLLVEFGDSPRYWINPDSPKGYFVEFALLQADEDAGGRIEKASVEGDPRPLRRLGTSRYPWDERHVQQSLWRGLCCRSLSQERLP